MRLAAATLALGLLLGGAVACTDDGGGDDGDDAPSVTGTDEAFCNELRTAISENSTIFDPLQPTTPDQTEAATASLADAAPEPIAEAMRLLADAFGQVAEVLAEHDASDPETVQAIEDLGLDQAALTDAQRQVSDYAVQVCGIDIEAINAASVTTTTTVTPPEPPATVAPATIAPTTTVVGSVPTTSAAP